ncbi:hypothetical protein LBMAG42_38060 [Deltaproteobacteria bacterium]|nr:hypothetical protein LBMAG42_38060 [Deltaproteobacteria bacterium]
MLFFVASAFAGPIFLTMSDPVELDVSGSWVRVFAAEGGWHVTHAAAGNFHYAWLPDSLELDRSTRRDLTTRTNLLDHAVSLCPDGTYLHVASATVGTPDDTIYSFRYDENFQPIYDGIVEEANPNGVDMDPPVVCGSWVQAAGHSEREPWIEMELEFLAEDLTVTGSLELEGPPEAAGSAMYTDDNYLWAVGDSDAYWEVMHVAQYAPDLSLVQQWDVDVAIAGSHAYWYQRMEKVRDTFIVAHMMRTDADSWSTQNGNVYLSAFDADWNLIDQMQITNIAAPIGAFYAWFDRKEDMLLVSYHSDTPSAHNDVKTVIIDLDACGPEAVEDTGVPVDTGDTGDTGDTSELVDTSDTGQDVSVDSGDSADTGSPADTGNGDGGGCGCGLRGGEAGWTVGLVAVASVGRRFQQKGSRKVAKSLRG